MPASPRHLALLLVLPLAACSSGGGGGLDGSDTIPGTFAGRSDLYNSNLNRIGWTDVDPDPNYTDPATLPQTGSAAFNGVMFVDDLGESRELLGRAQLSVDFAGNDITGSATDFRDDAGALHTGTLILDGTNSIDRGAGVTNYAYALEVDGSLVYPDAGTQTFDGQLLGDFYNGGEYVYADTQADDAFLEICDIGTLTCRDEFAGVLARDTD